MALSGAAMTLDRFRFRAPRIAALAPLAAVFVLAACQTAPPGGGAVPAAAPPTTARISGTVVHRDRKALPENAQIGVWLGVIGDDARIAEKSFPTQGRQVPIPFEFDVDLAKVEPGKAYSLHVAIRIDGQVRYVTGARVSIVPAEPPSGLTVLVVPGTDETIYAEAEAPGRGGPPRRGAGQGRKGNQRPR